MTPQSKIRAAWYTRITAILIGVLLLLWVYYDPFPKNIYHNYVMGEVAGLGVVLTAGTVWFWLRRRKRRHSRDH